MIKKIKKEEKDRFMKRIEAREIIERDSQISKINAIKNKKVIIPDELIKAFDELIKIIDKFKFRKQFSISMRVGMIIVLEEFILIKKDNKRSSYNFNDVYEESNSKFVLSTRNKARFNYDLDYIHPKNPRLKFIELHQVQNYQYERLVSEYKKALTQIITSKAWYIDEDEVAESINSLMKSPIFN